MATTRKKSTRRTATRKPASGRPATARKSSAKKGAARKATARTTTAKKTPAKRTSAKKAPAKKASARKAPVRPRGSLAEYDRKRDFAVTAEPAGEVKRPVRRRHALRFVIQKHAASHLHFDLRLECDGVMKSWAVPKGPSLDPKVRRLAMQVEDHPIAYNSFEGTIPQGEYGGGTVMLWDRGTYAPVEGADDANASVHRQLEQGKLVVAFEGERMHGRWTLVRTGSEDPGKPQWLLIKGHDDAASAKRDLVAREVTSVTTGRTMDQIASDADRTWRSNR